MAEPVEPITEKDDAIKAALEEAHLPSLIAALVHVTGDVSLVTHTPLVSVASAAGGQVPGQSSKLAKNRRMSRHTTIQPLPRPRSDPARTKMGMVPSC